MAKKSYDVSKNFSSNMSDKIKDDFDFSPAQNPSYNFKEGCVGGIHIGGVSSEPKNMYTKMERMGNKKMSKMEQDREMA